MGRLFLSDDRVARVVALVIPQYLVHRSVNRLCTAMSQVAGRKILPNRVHTLLSERTNQSVNPATLTAVEQVVRRLPAVDRKLLREQTIAYRAVCDQYPSLTVQALAKKSAIPAAVVRYLRDPAQDFRGEELVSLLQRLHRMLGDIRGASLIRYRVPLIPVLEGLSQITNHYLRMLKSVEETPK